MERFKAGAAMRFFLFLSGSVLWLGIYLTGFHNVHWLLYVPAVFFYFAALTGICPGYIVSQMVFKDRNRLDPTATRQ